MYDHAHICPTMATVQHLNGHSMVLLKLYGIKEDLHYGKIQLFNYNKPNEGSSITCLYMKCFDE